MKRSEVFRPMVLAIQRVLRMHPGAIQQTLGSVRVPISDHYIQRPYIFPPPTDSST